MVRDEFAPSAFGPWFSRNGPLLVVSRSRLLVAQFVSLAAMAFCYFLAPHFAWAYAAVAVGGFLTLALPAVTGGPLGVTGQRLIDASPGRRHLPGGTGYTLRLAVTLLIPFAVPAAVAAPLPPPIAARSTEPWIALVCLVVMAGALVGVVSLAGQSRKDLTRFLVVAAAAVILSVALGLPGLPLLSSLPGIKPT